MGTETKTLDLAVKVTNGIKITLDKTAVTVYPKSTAAVTASVSGSGTITADSGDKNIATVAVSGKTITVTGVKKEPQPSLSHIRRAARKQKPPLQLR